MMLNPDAPGYADEGYQNPAFDGPPPGPRCDEGGCHEITISCFLPDDPDRVDGHYCPEHAIKNGFCGACGTFSAGIESFDFGRYAGYCPTCQDEFEAQDEAGDEDEDFDAEVGP